MQTGRHGFLLRGPGLGAHDVPVGLGFFGALESPGPAHPDVNLADPADDPRLDEFRHAAVIFSRLALGSHLGGHLRLSGRLRHLPGFPDAVGEGLLAVDVFAELEGGEGGEGVRVFAGGDQDGLEALLVVPETAEIHVGFCVRVFFRGLLKIGFVDIAQGDEVLPLAGLHVGGPPAARPDGGDGEAVVGGTPLC